MVCFGAEQRYERDGMPDEAKELKRRLEEYRRILGTLGMRDYQVLYYTVLIYCVLFGTRA